MTAKSRKIGFIGAGNMGEALIRGLVEARIVAARSILFSEPAEERARHVAASCRVRRVSGNADLARRSDAIFLAVKPQHVGVVLREIGPAIGRGTLLVSVAAGVPLRRIETLLGAPARLVRVMPNTPALVGAGATAVSFGSRATAADRKFVMGALRAVGRAVEVDESLMDAVTGLSGSGPAYVFSFIQALADGGVREGLPRELALELAAQTVLGAARMVLETGRHPLELRDQVASPGGTTIQGIAVLEEKGFKGTVMAAVAAAAARSRQLAGQ